MPLESMGREPKFLQAGPSYGRSCFPKDTLALLKSAEDYDVSLRIVEAVAKVNDHRKCAMGRRVIDALGHSLRSKNVTMLGLTFKPKTNDMRDAPSIAIAQALVDGGIPVSTYDPEGIILAQQLMLEVKMAPDAYRYVEGADAVVIVTGWDTFRALDLARMKVLVTAPVLIDKWNVYNPKNFEPIATPTSA